MPLPTLPLDADQPAGPSRRQLVLGTAAAAAAALLPATSHAQSAWPSKPVRVIVPFPPGGLTDAYARSYCEFMSRKFGQPFNIENKTGAGGTLGAGELAKSPPDGHTLLISTSTALRPTRLNAALPHLTDTVPFSASTVTMPSGMRRSISQNRRAPMSTLPGSGMSASMVV